MNTDTMFTTYLKTLLEAKVDTKITSCYHQQTKEIIMTYILRHHHTHINPKGLGVVVPRF